MNILDLIPRWVLLAALAGSSAFGAYQWYAHISTENLLLKERTNRAEEDATRAEVAEEAEHTARETEYKRAVAGQGITDALTKEIQARDSLLGTERAAAGRLRGAIADYAASRGPAGQTCTAELAGARDRAATLGDLLDQADVLAGDFADAAERHASQARTLKARVVADRLP